MKSEIKNAVIKKATITNDVHNLLTIWLQLDYGGTEQAFGGFALYIPKRNASQVQDVAGKFIWRVMEIADVTEWGQLAGKAIRAKATMSKVEAIGHILKEDWFVPSKELTKEGQDNDNSNN